MSKRKNINLKLFLVLLVIWTVFVLYPKPGYLAISLYRLHKPPLEPLLITALAQELRDLTPEDIQTEVYNLLPYSYDWQTYNLPWYFPTLEEALINASGDCKARYLLFASILEELDIPYQKNISLSHIWVHYEGKKENLIENSQERLIDYDEEGKARFSVPRPDIKYSYNSFRTAFWDFMPHQKKKMILAGPSVAFIGSCLSAPIPAVIKKKLQKREKIK